MLTISILRGTITKAQYEENARNAPNTRGRHREKACRRLRRALRRADSDGTVAHLRLADSGQKLSGAFLSGGKTGFSALILSPRLVTLKLDVGEPPEGTREAGNWHGAIEEFHGLAVACASHSCPHWLVVSNLLSRVTFPRHGK